MSKHVEKFETSFYGSVDILHCVSKMVHFVFSHNFDIIFGKYYEFQEIYKNAVHN